jgi:Rrf2 family protein
MKVTKSSAYALHALMYMVRHSTQLPATAGTIARAEGIPCDYLVKILQQLVKAGFVKAVRGRKRGYAFAKAPEEINLLDLFEVIEGHSLFDECFLKHCDCGGTIENCRIFTTWADATRQIKDMLLQTSVASAAWNHPEHRFLSLSESLTGPATEDGSPPPESQMVTL